MTKVNTKGLTKALDQEGKFLESLFKKLAQFKILKSILDAQLDQKLASKCSIANFEEGHLSVITESAIWATQFRFQIPMIQKKLLSHPEFLGLRQITCRVRPALAKETTQQKPRRAVDKLSEETANIVAAAADAISHDKLKAIMQRIASRRKK